MGLAHKLLDIIPSAVASRAFGVVADHAFPQPVQHAVNSAFARLARLNMQESGVRLEDCRTLNALFTRPLAENARVISSDDVVSPVDGTLSFAGRICEGTLLEAKGRQYDVTTLAAADDPELTDWMRDAYAFTIYLSPSNYHRIHAPSTGSVTHVSYAPGRLLPVNRLGYLLADDLLPANERLTSFIETSKGRRCALVKVGATCVGKITLLYDDFKTNRSLFKSPFVRKLPTPWQIVSGEQIACFELGSTVVLLVESRSFVPNAELYTGMPVKMGFGLGSWEE